MKLKSANKQVLRLIRFVDAMKAGRYPNATSFAEELYNRDIGENRDLKVCTKTIKRDITYLINELGAPVEYVHAEHGYHLYNPDWALPYLQLQNNELLASLLCSQLGQSLLPSPLQPHLESAKEVQLAAGNADGISGDLLKSVVLATGTAVEIRPEIAATIVQAWKDTRTVKISYTALSGEQTEREIDPHALFLADAVWHARAYCHLREEFRSFAIHRIQQATLTDKRFERSAEIVREVRSGHVFDYEAVRGVVVQCDKSCAAYIAEREWFPTQTLKKCSGGGLELRYNTVPRELFITWIMSMGGDLTVIAPADLRQEIAKASAKLHERHS